MKEAKLKEVTLQNEEAESAAKPHEANSKKKSWFKPRALTKNHQASESDGSVSETTSTLVRSGGFGSGETSTGVQAMVKCTNLVKIYKTKDFEVMALRGLDLDR